MAEKITKQSEQAFEKMSAATDEAANVVQNSYSTALKGVQDFNSKFMEFTQTNIKTATDFVQKMSGVTSPSEFYEVSTKLAQHQLTTLTEQTKELAALAQRVTLASAEPLKTGVAKVFSIAS